MCSKSFLQAVSIRLQYRYRKNSRIQICKTWILTFSVGDGIKKIPQKNKTVSLLRVEKEKVMIGSINKVPYNEQVSIAYNIFAKGNTRKEEAERINDR